MTFQTALATFRDRTAASARRGMRWVRAHPLIAAALLPGIAFAYVAALVPFTPSIGDIKKAKLEYPTVVMSTDGKEIATYKRANRDWLKLADMSQNVVDALISTEDRRFFDHHGMDFRRTASALVNTVKGDRQGGSTITQQLARNLYPDEIGRAPTITRKLKEAITAAKIEAIYTKEEILETYLNTVPFLYNAFGVEMAARTYFDKPANKLDVVEAATLVGMLKGTSMYNPVLNPERSLERRNTVMAMMVKNGKLEQPKMDSLKLQPLGLDFEKLPEVAGPAPHLARHLRQWLGEWSERNGYNLYSDGLVVRTTIDSRVQGFANEAVKQQMDKLQGAAESRRSSLRGNPALVQAFVREMPQYRLLREQGRADAEALAQLSADADFMKQMWADKTMLTAGFMAMEPGTGYVRAWVGSRDFQADQFDHVSQARRQPGSTFKPFVYAAAFESGMSPSAQLMDGPVEIRIDERTVWRPKDVEAPSMQMMSLRDALAKSKNSVTAQLMQHVGAARVASLAQSMGVRQSKLDVVPSLALGSSPVTLKEMVAAYGTIANSGSYVAPTLVTRIEDRSGNVLQEFAPSTPQVALATDAAHALLDVLRTAIEAGTGIRIRAGYGIKGDVAGKTGTTQNDTDGWFLLMHPQLVAGAWVGFNDARVTMLHDWGQGARSALPIVGEVVAQSLKAKVIDEKAQFAAPRIKAEDPSLLGRVGDWFGSIFGTPAGGPVQPEVAVAPSPDAPRTFSPYEPLPRVPDASIAGTLPNAPVPVSPDASASTGNASILSLGGRPSPGQAAPPSIAIAPRMEVRNEMRNDTVLPAPTSSPQYIPLQRSGSGPQTITLGSGSAAPRAVGGGSETSVVRDVTRAPSDAPIVTRPQAEAPMVNRTPVEAPMVNRTPVEAPMVNRTPVEAPMVNRAPVEVQRVNRAPVEAPAVARSSADAPAMAEPRPSAPSPSTGSASTGLSSSPSSSSDTPSQATGSATTN